MVSLSFVWKEALECVCIRFCLEKRQIPHEDKIFSPQLAVAQSTRAVAARTDICISIAEKPSLAVKLSTVVARWLSSC